MTLNLQGSNVYQYQNEHINCDRPNNGIPFLYSNEEKYFLCSTACLKLINLRKKKPDAKKKKGTDCIIPCVLSSIFNETMLKCVGISHSFTISK